MKVTSMMRTLCLNSSPSSACVARTAEDVRFGCSAKDVNSVFSWTFGRKGSAGQRAAILRSCCLEAEVAADIAEEMAGR